MTRLVLIFPPLGLALGWALDAPGASPTAIVLGLFATIAITLGGVHFFERLAR